MNTQYVAKKWDTALLCKPCILGYRCFATVPVFQKKISQTPKGIWEFWCERRDLNPYGITTRPSNVRVCRFRHSRISVVLSNARDIIAKENGSVKCFLKIFISFCYSRCLLFACKTNIVRCSAQSHFWKVLFYGEDYNVQGTDFSQGQGKAFYHISLYMALYTLQNTNRNGLLLLLS